MFKLCVLFIVILDYFVLFYFISLFLLAAAAAAAKKILEKLCYIFPLKTLMLRVGFNFLVCVTFSVCTGLLSVKLL